MGQSYEVNINGKLSSTQSVQGSLSANVTSGYISPIRKISGETVIPSVISGTGIHYDTTEGWNSRTGYIAERGHIYVYSDYIKKENDDGSITMIPAMKVGDRTSYLIDLPVVTTGDDEAWLEHINNVLIHVSDDDRNRWDNKISAEVNESSESLIFSF